MRILTFILTFITFSLFGQSKNDELQNTSGLLLSVDSISAYKNASRIAHSKGDFEEFKKYCVAILDIAKANDLKKLEAQALTNLGIYYSNLGELDVAIKTYLESSEMMKTLSEDKRSNLSILLNLGNLYNKIKDYDKAEKTMLEVIENSGSVADTDTFLMAAYIGLGTTAKYKKQYNTSIFYNAKAKDLATQLNRKDVIISSLLNSSDNYLILEDYNQVIDYCNMVLDDITNEDSKEQKARALVNMGEALVKKKHPLKALPYLEQANKLATTGRFFQTKIKTHNLLSTVFESTGDLKKSLEQQKEYARTKEAYLNTLSKAQRLEVEIESTNKTNLLSEQKKELNFLTREKWLFIIAGIVLSILLITSFFVFKTRKKKLIIESTQLKEDKKLLENENEVLQDKLKEIPRKENTNRKSSISYKQSSLTIEEQEIYMQQILDYMDTNKPYLNPEIKQSDIAEKLSISVHLFSEVLNVCFRQNFNSFINLYRVTEAKSLIKNPKFKDYKILSVGYEAGFSSKTSFNRVFKNLVGCTPSEYQKQNL